MKKLWNRIIHYKFNIEWVFGFLITAIILLMVMFAKLVT
jgi:hypothetical protein